jgi:hypothetical protein
VLADEEIRGLLRQAQVPPTQLAIAGLLHAGRRRVRQRRLGALGGVAVLAVAVVAILLGPGALAGRQGAAPVPPAVSASPDPAPSDGACPMTDLAVPDGAHGAEATAISANGRYIAGMATMPDGQRPIMWTDGVPRVLSPDFGLVGVVNSAGTAVMQVQVSATVEGLRVSTAGGSYLLAGPAGTHWVQFVDPLLNDRGDIVAVGVDDHSGTAVLSWPGGAVTGHVVALPGDARVNGIGEDGTLVGFRGDRTPWVWDSTGHGRQLPIPAGWARAELHSIRAGQVVGALIRDKAPSTGASLPGKPAVVGAVWSLSGGEPTQLPELSDTGSINAAGRVTGPTQGLQRDWVVLSGHDIRRLAMPTGWSIRGTSAISDNGRLAGEIQMKQNGQPVNRAVTWQC